MARGQRYDRRAQTSEDRIGLNEERAGLQFCEARESSGDLAFGTRRQDAKPHSLGARRFLQVVRQGLGLRVVRVHQQGYTGMTRGAALLASGQMLPYLS